MGLKSLIEQGKEIVQEARGHDSWKTSEPEDALEGWYEKAEDKIGDFEGKLKSVGKKWGLKFSSSDIEWGAPMTRKRQIEVKLILKGAKGSIAAYDKDDLWDNVAEATLEALGRSSLNSWADFDEFDEERGNIVLTFNLPLPS